MLNRLWPASRTGSGLPQNGKRIKQEVSMPKELFTLPIIALIIFVIYIISVINILPEYERGVIFRLGRLLPQAKGPGLILVFRPIDRIVRISLRTVAFDVPPQDIITRDNVTVSVNAVVYFRVIDPRRAVVEVENFLYATSQLAQTTLRSVLGEAELDDLLAEREKLNARLQQILDLHTDPWGIKVALVEIKAVDLPQEMRRAMSRQAEAEREKRAKIIHADGEYQASEKLLAAARVIAAEPVAVQLRYLQTLTEIGVEQNTTVVFPLPLDMISTLINAKPKQETFSVQPREPVEIR
jgi:regulator of protease activity HflC (stomatin/prohibitin superfamily)